MKLTFILFLIGLIGNIYNVQKGESLFRTVYIYYTSLFVNFMVLEFDRMEFLIRSLLL